MKTEVTCTCGTKLAVPQKYLGGRIQCPACHRELSVGADGNTGRDPSADRLPQPPFKTQRRSDEISYEIVGDDLQMLIVELDPGETVIAEAGAMTYMEEGIEFSTRMGDGSQPSQGFLGRLMSAGKRAVTGESIFMTHFHQRGSRPSHVAFASPYPGKIIPIDLATIPGHDLLCQKDAFLCAAKGTEVSVGINRKLAAGLFGGEGFLMQKLVGDGMAFIHAGGTIIERELRGEQLRVDTGCLVAFEPHLDYDIERAGDLKSMFFGGEGLFLATLSGHGRVWLQSLPFTRLAGRVLANSPLGMSRTGEGSVLGMFGDLIDGN